MNEKRRRELKKAQSKLEDAKLIVEQCRDEEQKSYNNLGDNLQCGEMGMKMEDAVMNLGDAADSIEDALNMLEEAME